MAKVAIVYWSGSGNTEAMAQAVEEAAKSAGAETFLSFVSDTTASDVAAYDRILLGCPAMGNEELEEYEFEPFFAEILPQLKGKIVGIFGSFSWNQGDWIENWKQRLTDEGIELAAEPVKAYSYPDDEALTACKALGEAVAKA